MSLFISAVTFCSINEAQPKKVDVTMNTGDTVGRLKEEVLKKAIGDSEWGSPLTTLIVAEVVNHHVSRILVSFKPSSSRVPFFTRVCYSWV
jgi:hypothetical protein